MAKPHRVAFLTPEFVTETNAGGMASYLGRMVKAVAQAGHEAEVFVLSPRGPGVMEHEGTRVHLVRADAGGSLRWYRGVTQLPVIKSWHASAEILSGAQALAEALERRNEEAPFDLVQSSDYFATGWYVKKCAGRKHVVRCSMARELLAVVDRGDSRSMRRTWMRYEIESVRHAELVYAPSKYVAEYYAQKTGRKVGVVRPPMLLDVALNGTQVKGFPQRYLLHFGQLRAYKGTMWLLDALPRAWELAPEMRMVFVGPVRDSGLRRRLAKLLKNEKRLLHVDTLTRGEMYGVVREAVATVLPSLEDNLPNTVIESLCMGVPVIGTNGASVDELVVNGRHGELVPAGDVAGLARAMARAWKGESVKKGFVWDAKITREMESHRAVEELGRFVGMELAEVTAR